MATHYETLEDANRDLEPYCRENSTIYCRKVLPEEEAPAKFAVVLIQNHEEIDIVGSGDSISEAMEDAMDTLRGEGWS